MIVAVLDTGIAYRNVGHFRRSPGFYPDQFVRGYDFVDPGAYPVDHNGHGTFVAGEIAEATNNAIGLTGLAYGARLMPVRVLDGQGEGDASTIIASGVLGAHPTPAAVRARLTATATPLGDPSDRSRYGAGLLNAAAATAPAGAPIP